jgi:hypothetical protein
MKSVQVIIITDLDIMEDIITDHNLEADLVARNITENISDVHLEVARNITEKMNVIVDVASHRLPIVAIHFLLAKHLPKNTNITVTIAEINCLYIAV